MKMSIIIPTLNEVIYLRSLVIFLTNHPYASHLEIIVVDGGSTDKTLESISDVEGVLIVESAVASRSVQMNIGAAKASGEVLYFVHAETQLPTTFYEDIQEALSTYQIGGYRCKYEPGNLLLHINAFFTRFPMMWCRGGDQTLFITRSFFDELGGYDQNFCVMEDFDLIRRASESTTFKVLPKSVKVSSRKYDHNSYLKVQLTNLKAFQMFKRGDEPQEIRKFYKKTLGLLDY